MEQRTFEVVRNVIFARMKEIAPNADEKAIEAIFDIAYEERHYEGLASVSSFARQLVKTLKPYLKEESK